ncbi:MAG TPA: glycerol-3-phosphate 1-O-acyltransferase PlsY [Terriglobales bacterium]|nr:glycerol-3-phosphate 1-O-acyltransferase PlsY [Terriglobales bacterium]
MSLLITAGLSYLLGSIPFGYLLVRIFRGEDVRQTGSGNIGATNVSRTSPVLGLATLLLDALKGAAAVILALALSGDGNWMQPSSVSGLRAATAAFFVVIGHVFPVWLKFRGGKGVATGLGSFIILAPKALLFVVGIFIAVVLLFRYVSLGSILAVALFPLAAWSLHDYGGHPANLALMAATALLIILKHHENIRRLVGGTEPRFGSRRG